MRWPPNQAATSIVEANEDKDYEKRKAELKEARALELEALERDYARLKLERKQRDKADSGGGWWIF
ncbi:hypothetical protein [Marinobacter sp.]|uniref:hypothetical protein n=1 Tax=Marinobacter sp. TaxID=50741 RepID=UPI0019FA5F87|nr:hypothetical protein [Marinobacter sp.]MBE0486741.1 hypothetical protein [Marinobacter sp.]